MKYIIVGAVAGGASTAARLRRLDEHAEIVIFEKGGYISYANCGLPYYIGSVIKERDHLFVQTAASFTRRFNVDVRINTVVERIDRKNKTITARDLQTGREYAEPYDKLVLSPGAEPVRPPLPGLGLKGIFTLRNVPDTDQVKEFVGSKPGGHAVIVGAGFIGLEMAENLHGLGMEVTVVEMANQVLAPVDYPIAAIVQQYLRGQGIKLALGKSVAGFQEQGDGISVSLNDGDRLYADVVILSIGVRPDTRLAKEAGLELGPSGAIRVNEYLQTSDPDVYAVGDAIEYTNPVTGRSMSTYLAGPANKQGRICAVNLVHGNTARYHGSVNTAIVKLFGMTIGATGVAAKHLQAQGIPHVVSTTQSGSHAGYYPGAQPLTIQVVFAPGTGRLLGAQVAGFQGVDKRLDVLSAILQRGGSIYDLAEFEHAYAPPFSSAKDPVNMAGFVATNILDDGLPVAYWHQLGTLAAGDLLVDVRTADEYEKGTIPGAINIPVDELRLRLHHVVATGNVYVFCQVGQRGYLAQRILRQHGIAAVSNVSGGYALWLAAHTETELLSPSGTSN